jgi:protein FrlC
LAESGYAGKITFEPFGNGSYALDPVAAWKRNLAAIEPYLDGASVGA